MKPKDVKRLLWEIGKTNPRFLGILQKEVDDDLTVGTHWAKLLADLDDGYLRDVLADMAEGKRRIPDEFVYEVRQEVQDLTRKEAEQTEQHERFVRYQQIKSEKRKRKEKVSPISQLLEEYRHATTTEAPVQVNGNGHALRPAEGEGDANGTDVLPRRTMEGEERGDPHSSGEALEGIPGDHRGSEN